MDPIFKKKPQLRISAVEAVAATLAAAAALACLSAPASAQPAVPMANAKPDAANQVFGLRQVFDAAWARQPEAVALQARRDAVSAQRNAAMAWTPEPAALELSTKTDRLGANQGAREIELGVSVPLWLPGERGRTGALADAEAASIESRTAAAQLRLAASVREAWWQWQRAQVEVDTARDQLGNTRRIAADVARRVQAGDLARADQHQADGAVASSEVALAQAQKALHAARQLLRALVGTALVPTAAIDHTAIPEPEPDPAAVTADVQAHAALQELQTRANVAERTAALTAIQTRANPELTLATTRDRGARSEAAQQSITVGVRIPFGAGPRHGARIANARADATEAQAQLALELDRVIAEREAAMARVQISRTQWATAQTRARLASELRGFFDKSFRLGETDLPTRLRIEAEATEAERNAMGSKVELAAAISAWRQALGLLPR